MTAPGYREVPAFDDPPEYDPGDDVWDDAEGYDYYADLEDDDDL